MLAVMPAEARLKPVGLMGIRGKIMVAMVRRKFPFCSVVMDLIHRRFPEMVGYVVCAKGRD